MQAQIKEKEEEIKKLEQDHEKKRNDLIDEIDNRESEIRMLNKLNQQIKKR